MKSFTVLLRALTFSAVAFVTASQSYAGAIVSVEDVAGSGVPGLFATSTGGNVGGSWQFRTLSSDPTIAQAASGGTWNWQFDWNLLISDGSASTPVQISFMLTSPFSALVTTQVAALGLINSTLGFGGSAMLGLDPSSGNGLFVFSASIPGVSEDRLFSVVGGGGSISASPVPAPLTALLMATGLAALAFRRRVGVTRVLSLT